MTLYQFLIGVQYTSILLTLFMSAYILKKWKKPLHGWLFCYCVATLVNNVGCLALLQAGSEETAVAAWQFCYLGRVWIPFSLVQFVLAMGRKKKRRWVWNLLALFHGLTYLLVLGMRHNRLYYTAYSFTTEGLVPHLIRSGSLWHHVYVALILCYIVFGLADLFLLLRRQTGARQKKQLSIIVAAIFVDILFYFVQILDLIPGYDSTSMGYTVAALLLYVAIFRYDILGSKELARDFIIDSVSEGFIVTDEDGTVVDFNRKARDLLPELESEPQRALARVQALGGENRTLDVADRRYTPKENVLTDERHTAGKVYILADDTSHYRHTESLTREMMLALSKTVDAKDHYTNGHSQRVARYAAEIARRMGKSVEEQEKLYEMGLLHDIGKIGVREEIINKPGRLTDEEFAQIKQHTVIGYNILRQISAMPELADGARSHHERYDGRGYPDGLKGEAIPETARIICLADCYDAMTSTRTYSKPKSQAAVRAELERCRGSQFDPAIADVMISIIDDDPEYSMHE